jgi:hypothetical protein
MLESGTGVPENRGEEYHANWKLVQAYSPRATQSIRPVSSVRTFLDINFLEITASRIKTQLKN